MKQLALIATLAVLAAPLANAQTARFVGAGVQAGAGVTDFHMGGSPVLTLQGNIDNAENINKSGDKRATALLGAQYTFALNDQYTMAIALDGNPMKVNEGVATGAEADVKSKMESSYAISLQPGYALDADSLVYAKLGYAQSKVANSYGGALGESGALGSLNSNTYKGFVVGAGYKRFFSANLYGFAEASYTKYRKERIIALAIFYADRDLKSFNATVGVGYKF